MLASGRKGHLTLRDEGILSDLYLAPSQTAEQVANQHFIGKDEQPSAVAAERRLYRIAEKGYIEPVSVTTPAGNRFKIWRLTEEAWIREHAHFAGSTDTSSMFMVKPGRLEHFLTTNDLYSRCSPVIRRYFGEPHAYDEEPSWSWRHEYLCEHEVTLGSRKTKVKPDAEIDILDTTLYLESQTRRSRASPERMQSKVDAYGSYFKYQLKDDQDKHQLLVLTEEPKITNAVEQKGKQLDVLVIAGDLDTVARHVEMTALRLS